MKLWNFLKGNPQIVAAVAACVSAFMAYKTWSYSREIFRPAPALYGMSNAVVVKDPNNLLNLTGFGISIVLKRTYIICHSERNKVERRIWASINRDYLLLRPDALLCSA